MPGSGRPEREISPSWPALPGPAGRRGPIPEPRPAKPEEIPIARPPGALIGKDDGPLAVEDGAVVDVVSDSAGQGASFAVAAEADEVLDAVVVVDAGNLLLDDRSGIEVPRDVVAGGTDEFDPALVGLAEMDCRTSRCP